MRLVTHYSLDKHVGLQDLQLPDLEIGLFATSDVCPQQSYVVHREELAAQD